MASIQTFELDSFNNVIVIPTLVNGKDYINLILDTGASHTVINLTRLIDLGYKISDTQGLTLIATANGIIEENTYLIPTISFAGIIKKDLLVASYHFETGDYGADGVLGLDFFKDLSLTIDFKNLTIEVRE